jgi:hypothetical protein
MATSVVERSPYNGATKQLLVSIDIGTTFTAVSFSILHPGEIPQFNEVRAEPDTVYDSPVPKLCHRSYAGQIR